MKRSLPLALLGAACLIASGAAAVAQEKADIVLKNATVYTMDAARPTAHAVAISGGRLAAVGEDADVAPLTGPKTRVLDLGGAAVFPGLYESHGHLLNLGSLRMSLDLVGTTSYPEIVERVAAAARRAREGQWITGRGWHEGKWKQPANPSVRGFPTHEALSAVSPRNPVVLRRADGHAMLVNKRVLELMGIGRDTKAPSGGEIVRDAQGEPTGILVDRAMDLVKVPPQSREEQRRALDLGVKECLSQGVTTFCDAGAPSEEIALYKEMASAGALGMRLYVMLGGLSTLKQWEKPEIGLGGGFLTIRAVKLYADGALGSRGAALLEPYADDPGNSGFLTTPPETLLEATRLALDRGFQVCTHAIGDRANRTMLDIYEKALKERPQIKDARLRIEHAQILDAQDIPRFAALGVIASMQGIHATSDRPWAPARIGMDRIREGAYVWQKLLKSGARIVNGSDVPVEEVSPIKGFYASVTRQDESGNPPGGFDPDQRMSREEALRSYTLDAAFGTFTESTNGSIVPGKRADLTVLSKDIMKVPEPEILKTEVLYTIVDGRIRYERQR
jgi:predicted amidohydrolase YtcJ